jgi:hypothetical protein
MTIEFHNTHNARTWAPARLLLALCLGLALFDAGAATPAEDNRNKAPMPHEVLGAGRAMVKVHWTRLDGYLEGRPDHVAQLAQLKAQVAGCVQLSKAGGRPTKPVQAWPDFVNSLRTDTYASANRTIVYSSGLVYGLNPADCSVLETRKETATLSSSKGNCVIDLLDKTARGACDARAHADAAPRPRPAASTMADVEDAQRSAPGNPALAALAAAMRQHPPGGSGVRKTILGIECEVLKLPFDPDASVCLSLGGSFAAAHAAAGTTGSGMDLETTSSIGARMQATRAQLDALVNGAVFAPYLGGGFRVVNNGARK